MYVQQEINESVLQSSWFLFKSLVNIVFLSLPSKHLQAMFLLKQAVFFINRTANQGSIDFDSQMAFAVPIFNEGFAVPIFSEGFGLDQETVTLVQAGV